MGEPLFPVWFELLFVGAIGSLPILWMQWQRPFSIFSLVLLALQPAQLTEDQRRILQRFKTPLNRILAVLSAVAMVWVLWWLYQIAPLVSPPLFPGINRGLALLLAAIGFLGSNLFVQVPVSVLAVLLTPDATFAATPPYAVEHIAQDFTIPGIRVSKILPSFARSIPSVAAPEPPVPPEPIPNPDPFASNSATPDTISSPVPPSPPSVPSSPPAAEPPKTESNDELEEAELKNPFDYVLDNEFDDEASAAGSSAIQEPGAKKAEMIQLSESQDVTEEIVILPPPAPAVSPVAEIEPGLEASSGAIEPHPETPAYELHHVTSTDSVPSPEETTTSEDRAAIDSVLPLSKPPIEIMEDATIGETLDSDSTDWDADQSDPTNADAIEPELSEIEPQQGAAPSNPDPWD